MLVPVSLPESPASSSFVFSSHLPSPDSYCLPTMCLVRGQPTFCVKGQIILVLGSVGHRVSAATTQLCPGSTKAVKEWVGAPLKLSKSRCWGRFGHGHSFLALVLGAGVTEVNRQTRGLLLHIAKP